MRRASSRETRKGWTGLATPVDHINSGKKKKKTIVCRGEKGKSGYVVSKPALLFVTAVMVFGEFSEGEMCRIGRHSFLRIHSGMKVHGQNQAFS